MMPPDQEAIVGINFRRGVEAILAVGTLLFGMALVLAPTAFAARVYTLMAILAPQTVWALGFVMLGGARCCFLIVNGYFPLSAKVRLNFARVSLVAVWFPLTVSFWWFAIERAIGAAGGAVLPGIMLAPLAAAFEVLCLYALTALAEFRKRASQ